MDNTKSTQKTSSNRFIYIFTALLTLLAVVFTILVATLNVAPAGPDAVEVGFSGINADVAETFPFNKTWYVITSSTFTILPVLIIPVFYIGLGVIELVKRKSFKKVDHELYILAGFYLAMFAIFIFFEKFLVLNYRPVLLGGPREPSYPSSHTLFTMCICGSAIIINQKLLAKLPAGNTKSKKLNTFTKIVGVALVALAIFVITGRFLSGVHWLTDILGGLIISAALLALFYSALTAIKPKTKSN